MPTKHKVTENAKVDPQPQVDAFLAKFTPEIEAQARACLKKLRTRLNGAFELIYDNYNALAFGFGPTERASDALFSLVLYPRWVTLFFLRGASLPDPKKILKGGGSVVRHVVLTSPADLDRPEIRELMDTARVNAKKDISPQCGGRVIVKSIAAKQRPRRPAQSKA